ncbi:MAG TPA: hypothetical protein VK698_33590 [Kofleriaceae bacterium]|nr:hypothetical protein [Kofleriaceae bacterium]
MRGQRLGATLFAGSILAVSGAALAVRPRDAARIPSARPATRPTPALETAPGSGLRARDPMSIASHAAPPAAAAAWASFQRDAGGAGWRATWDDATGVPSRLFGRGIAAPRAVRDPAAAERHARAFLARHIDLVAPGAAPGDFELVANVERDGMRVLGFRQMHAGMPVLGGQVSFRFKNDRLFVIGSEALPHVRVPAAALAAIPAEVARGFARSWVLADAAGEADAGDVSGPFVLPLIGRGGAIEYRVVHRVEVPARRPVGRFWVYTDAATGAPVAREQRLRFADGEVQYNVPVRWPEGGRADYPARSASLTIDGASVVSTDQGQVSWAGSAPGALVARVVGPLVQVINRHEGDPLATRDLTIDPGGTATWADSGDEEIEAQLTGFIHARVVKEYARTINPELGFLDQQLAVNVNIADQCNAFSDGDTVNFFQSSPECANTGLLADVVYHEFGHAFHAHSIVQGVGTFDGAHSEGLADFLAASITGDPGMGRGFFRSDDPLRHIDPPDYENTWPRDVGEVHLTGLIFAGAMWDLRKLFVAQFGEVDGIALTNRLYYATLMRATSIPTTYVEMLAEDDDDGDLSNGTPHACDINSAFGAHGLRAVAAEVDPLAAELPGPDGFPVGLRVAGFFSQCPGDGVAAARVEWRLRDQAADQVQSIDMTEGEDGQWSASIPTVPAGNAVRYRLLVDLLDGSSISFPDNLADPEYEFYVGEVEPLYCTDFETDPFGEGWTHGSSGGLGGEGADDWAWGAPMSPIASGDPIAAFSGQGVIGTDLGGSDEDGMYQGDIQTFAQSPVIDVSTSSDVRIQYWRWLTVEDAHFDQATIYASGRQAWRNLDSDQGDESSTQHLDREWRFQDVPISELVRDGEVQIKFEMDSDGGLEFGGWTIDDFCVVSGTGATCGDGAVTGAETCDEGAANSDSEPDACRTSCRVAACGDGVVDRGEACDDGNNADADLCSADCSEGLGNEGDCGCEVAPRSPLGRGGSAILLLLGTLVLLGPRLARRSRRRSSRPARR